MAERNHHHHRRHRRSKRSKKESEEVNDIATEWDASVASESMPHQLLISQFHEDHHLRVFLPDLDFSTASPTMTSVSNSSESWSYSKHALQNMHNNKATTANNAEAKKKKSTLQPAAPKTSKRIARLEERIRKYQIHSKHKMLPPLKQARPNIDWIKQKSFLVGDTGSDARQHLGMEELTAVLPDHQLKLFVLTWNMAELQDSLSDWQLLLLPERLKELPDMVVISLQECPYNMEESQIHIQEVLGPHFLPLQSAFHGSLGLILFISRNLLWYSQATKAFSVKTCHNIITKGAVGISFQLFGTSFLFMSSHLRADIYCTEHRIDDYHQILQSMNSTKMLPEELAREAGQDNKENNSHQNFDVIIWAGDLNFRIILEREAMIRSLSRKSRFYESVMSGDELLQVQTEELAFHRFQEGRIQFPPTYKYDLQSDQFDTSKLNRTPAYTDRILFYCREKMATTCQLYDSIRDVKTSDHRGVFGLFNCFIKPGSSTCLDMNFKYNTKVYQKGTRRRAQHIDYTLADSGHNQCSRICTIL